MIIETGAPPRPGIYVGYFGDQRGILKWTGSGWRYAIMGGNFQFRVKGWIGPLPEFNAPPMEYDL